MLRSGLFVVILILLPLVALSQPPEFCGFKTTNHHIQFELNQLHEKSFETSDQFIPGYIPVVFHIIRTSQGQGGYPLEKLPGLVDDLNLFFADSGINFYLTPRTIFLDDTEIHDRADSITILDEILPSDRVDSSFNIYIGPNGVYGGWGEFLSLSEIPGLYLDSASVADYGNGPCYLLLHEAGHYFGLYHTFDTDFGYECPDGSNCETAGDLICDTPADPNDISTINILCEQIKNVYSPVECSRDPYHPLYENLMSYYTFCHESFTQTQYDKMRYTLDNYGSKVKRMVYYQIDTTQGWAPFEVGFSGESYLDLIEYSWDFGDGQIGNGQTNIHTYLENGVYTVTLTGITSDSLYSNNIEQKIFVFGDSALIQNKEVYIGANNYIEIYGNNTLPLKGIEIPFKFENTLNLNFDSVSLVGCRPELTGKIKMSLYRPFTDEYAAYIEPKDIGGSVIDSGMGPLMRIYFTIDETAAYGELINLNLGGIEGYDPVFTAKEYSVNPLTNQSSLIVTYNCCRNYRGNVDNDPEDIMDIADLVYLIEYSFGSDPPQPEPVCFDESDVDASGVLDVEDIVFMVDYMFRGGEAPAYCF